MCEEKKNYVPKEAKCVYFKKKKWAWPILVKSASSKEYTANIVLICFRVDELLAMPISQCNTCIN